MAIRKIIKKGDDTLRKHSREVTDFDDKLALLIDDMACTMYKADGVGIAAPQVGILKRVVVMDCGRGRYDRVNPSITDCKGDQYGVEGCLSVPGVRGSVHRPAVVNVEYYDRYGDKHVKKFDGLEAVCACHEIDHLDGILFVDKMDKESR